MSSNLQLHWTPHSDGHPRIIPERLGSVLSTDETVTAKVQRPCWYWIAFFINTIWDIRGRVRARPGDNNWECWQHSRSCLGCNIFWERSSRVHANGFSLKSAGTDKKQKNKTSPELFDKIQIFWVGGMEWNYEFLVVRAQSASYSYAYIPPFVQFVLTAAA